jgi:hypothetical protein
VDSVDAGGTDDVNNSTTIFGTLRVPVHIIPGERFRVDADDGKVTIYYVPGVTRQRDIDRALQAAVLPPPEVRIEKEETERDAALVAEAEAEHRAWHAESGWARAEKAEAERDILRALLRDVLGLRGEFMERENDVALLARLREAGVVEE